MTSHSDWYPGIHIFLFRGERPDTNKQIIVHGPLHTRTSVNLVTKRPRHIWTSLFLQISLSKHRTYYDGDHFS